MKVHASIKCVILPVLRAENFIAERIGKAGLKNSQGISGPIVKLGISGIAVGLAAMILSVSVILGFKREITARITGLTTHITIGHPGSYAGSEPAPIVLSEDTLRM